MGFAIAWTLYFFMVTSIMLMRTHMRARYNIWGSTPEDFTIALVMFPFALAQMKMRVMNDGAGGRGYWADLTDLIEFDANEAPKIRSSTEDADKKKIGDPV